MEIIYGAENDKDQPTMYGIVNGIEKDFHGLKSKDFQAFWVGLVRRLTSAEFAFLFIVSNTYVPQILILITLKAKIFRTFDFKNE